MLDAVWVILVRSKNNIIGFVHNLKKYSIKNPIRLFADTSEIDIPRFKSYSISKQITMVAAILVFLLMLAFFFGTQKPLSYSKMGDAVITSVIAEKEFNTIALHKSVETKQDLDMLSKKKPLAFAFYRILPGENMSSVAQKFGLSISTVLSLNSLDNAHSVRVGQRILLATRSGIIYNSAQDEPLSSIAERYGISFDDTMLVNSLDSEDISEGKTLFLPGANFTVKAMAEILGYSFISPVKRFRFTSGFGYRRHPLGLGRRLHAGIDLAAPTGTPIYAAREGRVIFAGSDGGYGLMVRIRHQNGFATYYAHMSKIRVKTGDWVIENQRIGDVGNTGRSTGPHLHFEIRKYGKPVNPLAHGLQL